MATKKIQIIGTLIKQAENADTLDGKHADEFATTSAISEIYSNQNLFDATSSENVSGGILYTTGGVVALENYSYSHFIPVQEGATYCISGMGPITAEYTACLYDSNYAYVCGVKNIAVILDSSAGSSSDKNVTIPTGQDISFMRISYRDSNTTTCTVTSSSLGSTFGKMVVSNPLYGKKIALTGDSICKGAGENEGGDAAGGYGKIIAENNNMRIQNIGVGGATITENVLKDNGTDYRFCISTSIDSLDTDADYVIVEGGFNDCTGGPRTTLGTLTSDYISELDTETFYGAFENMCKKLLARFPTKKIGYISIHKAARNWCAEADESVNYYLAAKKCCEKWGIPFLDLTKSVPPLGDAFAKAEPLLSMKRNYTVVNASLGYPNGDGIHPTKAGYELFYVPKIEAWLKTL